MQTDGCALKFGDEVMASADGKELISQAVTHVEFNPIPPPDSHGIANPVLSQRSQLQLTDGPAALVGNPLQWVYLNEPVISIAGTPERRSYFRCFRRKLPNFDARSRLIASFAACCMLLQMLMGLSQGVLIPDSTGASETGTLSGVFVLPDDGPGPFLAELDAADHSILLYVYLLSNEEVIGSLLRAHHRGVDVRVMLDPIPYGGAGTELDVYQRLSAAGINVRWTSAAFRFAHVKMLIIDGTTVLIMNLNLTEAAFDQNREFAVVTNDPDRVIQALAIFENDWHGRAETPGGPLVVSPETSRADLLRFIASGEHSIDIYAEVMTDPQIMDALTDAVLRGVQVRLVMSQTADESLWHEEPGYLAQQGVEVRIMNRLYIHAKAVIVDGRAAWIGSQNFTANSLDNNREIGTFVNDTGSLARIIAAFESDFAESVPLEQPS